MPLRNVTIRDATVVRTGVDGGHRYLKGECDDAGDVVVVTALMANKAEEAKLRPGTHTVAYESADYTPGAGYLLTGCRLITEA
jgi:hypothetical protein